MNEETKNFLINNFSSIVSIIAISKIDITQNKFNYKEHRKNVYILYRIKTCCLQLEYLPIKTTTNKIRASGLRMMMSFMKTPFCTGIGQVCSTIYPRNYKLNTDRTISKKQEAV